MAVGSADGVVGDGAAAAAAAAAAIVVCLLRWTAELSHLAWHNRRCGCVQHRADLSTGGDQLHVWCVSCVKPADLIVLSVTPPSGWLIHILKVMRPDALRVLQSSAQVKLVSLRSLLLIPCWPQSWVEQTPVLQLFTEDESPNRRKTQAKLSKN